MPTITEYYDQIIKSHPKEMKDAILVLKEQMGIHNCKFGEDLVPTFLKPVFISSEQVQSVRKILGHIISILHKITELYFTHPDMRDFFYLDEKGAELVEIDHGYEQSVVIIRPDSFITNDIMRFVEFNCDSPAGPGYCDVEEDLFRETFPLKKAAQKYTYHENLRRQTLLNALLDCYKQFGGKKKNPNIAIIDWKEVRTQNEFYILKKYFKLNGYETVVADPRDLKYVNGQLEHEGFPIDLIYRRVIFKELVNRLDQVQDFINAYRDHKVCVVNPLRSRLASNKAVLAIMTNPKKYRDFFTDEENHIISRHVPWTRRVLDMQTDFGENKVFLRKHIMHHREGLVLKPADSYGGKDVVIGRECDQIDWEILINKIFSDKEDWVVQKYVDITQMNVPLMKDGKITLQPKKYNLNPFIFGGSYAGSMARLSDQSVINVSAGGGMVPVIEYSE